MLWSARSERCWQEYDFQNVDRCRNTSQRISVFEAAQSRIESKECKQITLVRSSVLSATILIVNLSTQYLAQMGYCPQQDAIIDKLNAWEHLYLFARLRGIPRMEVQAAVEKWILKLSKILFSF